MKSNFLSHIFVPLFIEKFEMHERGLCISRPTSPCGRRSLRLASTKLLRIIQTSKCISSSRAKIQFCQNYFRFRFRRKPIKVSEYVVGVVLFVGQCPHPFRAKRKVVHVYIRPTLFALVRCVSFTVSMAGIRLHIYSLCVPHVAAYTEYEFDRRRGISLPRTETVYQILKQ